MAQSTCYYRVLVFGGWTGHKYVAFQSTKPGGGGGGGGCWVWVLC